ncbi:MAG: hypothetical protein ACPG19_11755 [Saprospiraceae bacterium]
MRFLFLFIFIIFSVPCAIGQSYQSPPFEGKSTAMVDITKIEITNKYTIVYMSCTTPEEFSFGGWACITRTAYILDVASNKRLKLIRSKGIPYCPNKYKFSGSHQTIKFKLYFPKINYDVRHIHIIEDLSNIANPFNFYNVYLKPLAH